MSTPPPQQGTAGSYLAALEQVDPAFAALVTETRENIFASSALDDKTKRLIVFALDLAWGAVPGARAMAMAARQFGATDAELEDVVRVSFLNGGSQRITMGLAAIKQ